MLSTKITDDKLFMKLQVNADDAAEGSVCLNDFWLFDKFSDEGDEETHRVAVPLWLIKNIVIDDSRIMIKTKQKTEAAKSGKAPQEGKKSTAQDKTATENMLCVETLYDQRYLFQFENAAARAHFVQHLQHACLRQQNNIRIDHVLLSEKIRTNPSLIPASEQLVALVVTKLLTSQPGAFLMNAATLL